MLALQAATLQTGNDINSALPDVLTERHGIAPANSP
jgi:hypothetical protein